MLFQLANNTPRFEVFRLLNKELITFLENTVSAAQFNSSLFSSGTVGSACWGNAATKNKFEDLFNALHEENEELRRQLYMTVSASQDLETFYSSPNPALLSFLPNPCLEAFKKLATVLYDTTKDYRAIKRAAGGVDINGHFSTYRDNSVNGNICRACGMEELAAYRANTPGSEQWRADYDHQLCRSKYPCFAVHPDNLIPLCRTCNQDAKKAKDLFRLNTSATTRQAFYPYTESAKNHIQIAFDNLSDPEPIVGVRWGSTAPITFEKLETWDDIYQIRNRVEGKFRPLETIIQNKINPDSYDDFVAMIRRCARSVPEITLKTEEWAYWYQLLFQSLANIADLQAFYDKLSFVQQQGAEAGEYILGGAS